MENNGADAGSQCSLYSGVIIKIHNVIKIHICNLDTGPHTYRFLHTPVQYITLLRNKQGFKMQLIALKRTRYHVLSCRNRLNLTESAVFQICRFSVFLKDFLFILCISFSYYILLSQLH